MFAIMTLIAALAEQKYIPIQGASRERNQEIEKSNKTSYLDGISEEVGRVNNFLRGRSIPSCKEAP